MVPRSDGRAFDVEAVVNENYCLSCGICAGACPTSTPFRRAKPITPGIELPDSPVIELRERVLAASESYGDGARVLVFGCSCSGAESLQDAGAQVVSMPCVGMLPPSFVDFCLSRQLADGIMIAGCADGDCFYRLGSEWVKQRVAGERDPYLRKRVPLEKLELSWLRADAKTRRRRAFEAFREALKETTDA